MRKAIVAALLLVGGCKPDEGMSLNEAIAQATPLTNEQLVAMERGAAKMRTVVAEAEKADKKRRQMRKAERGLRLVTVKPDFSGGVASVRFTIRNDNDFPVRNPEIACDFLGQSGTVVGQGVEFVYETFPSLATRSTGEVTFGFVNTQAKRAACTIQRAYAIWD